MSLDAFGTYFTYYITLTSLCKYGNNQELGSAMIFHPLIHPLSLAWPDLPRALDNLRLLHLSDLHIHRDRQRYRDLAALLRETDYDLLLLTGDYMTKRGNTAIAERILTELISEAKPAVGQHGIFGVFGNHDYPRFIEAVSKLPIRWLRNAAHSHAELPLDIVGVDCSYAQRMGDLIHATADLPAGQHDGELLRFRLCLAHLPTWLPAAASLGVDLMLSGHTHGGQIRVPGFGPLRNATDWPLRLTCGQLQCRDAIAYVSRGIGEVVLDHLRIACPPEAPLITLKRGPRPTENRPIMIHDGSGISSEK